MPYANLTKIFYYFVYLQYSNLCHCDLLYFHTRGREKTISIRRKEVYGKFIIKEHLQGIS